MTTPAHAPPDPPNISRIRDGTIANGRTSDSLVDRARSLLVPLVEELRDPRLREGLKLHIGISLRSSSGQSYLVGYPICSSCGGEYNCRSPRCSHERW